MSFANAFYRMQMLKENAQRRRDEEEGMKATLGFLSDIYDNNRRATVEPYAQKATLAQIMQEIPGDVAASRNKFFDRAYFESLGMTQDEVDAAMAQSNTRPTESVRDADGSLSPVTPEMERQWADIRTKNLAAANKDFDAVNNIYGSNPYAAAQGMTSRQLKYALPLMVQQDKLIQEKMGEQQKRQRQTIYSSRPNPTMGNLMEHDRLFPRYQQSMGRLAGGGNTPGGKPQGDGRSPVMQEFAQALTGHIQQHGPEATRQWINQHREALQAKGIDPDAALRWIPQ